jgi:hypothetical protein
VTDPPSTRSPALHRLLAALAVPPAPDGLGALRGLDAAGWEPLLELAERHRVLPLLHRALEAHFAGLQVPPAVQARLRSAHRLVGVRNTLLLARLGELLGRLRDAGIPVLVLKGAHLAELIYEEVALRPMADVDLLVRPAQLAQAAELIGALGFRPEGAAAGAGARQQAAVDTSQHATPLVHPAGLRVEVHYAIEARAVMPAIDLEGLWRRAQPALIGGAEALVLAPEDLLLHLCTHAAIHHGFDVNLLHLCDLPVVVGHFGERLDWAAFWYRARAWGAERSALLTLALVERLLGWRRPASAFRRGTQPLAPADMVDRAERLLLEGVPPLAQTALPRLWGGASLADKARLLRGRAFPPREELAFACGVPASSPRLWLCYLARLGQLLARYARPVLRLLWGGSAASRWLEAGAERNRLGDWLLER